MRLILAVNLAGLETTFAEIAAVFLTLVIIALYVRHRKRDKEFAKVNAEIKRFQPSMRYENERPYQAELQGWLKHEFSHAQMEVQNGSSRPDIAIHKIAIEVKGPTGSQDLQTIADKCIRYYQYYDYIIAILFDPNYNSRMFEEWKKGMKEHFPKVQIFEKPIVKK